MGKAWTATYMESSAYLQGKAQTQATARSLPQLTQNGTHIHWTQALYFNSDQPLDVSSDQN